MRFQPFRFFDDLVENNYSILAELEHVWYAKAFPIKVGNFLEHFQSGSYSETHSFQTPAHKFWNIIDLWIDSIMKTFVYMLPYLSWEPFSISKSRKNI